MSCAFSARVNPPRCSAVAQATNHFVFLVGFNWSYRPFLVSICAIADGRMRIPGQGLLAMGSPPSIQHRVHVKTGAVASNVFQSCVPCRLILKSFSLPLAATDEVVHPKLAHVAKRHRRTGGCLGLIWSRGVS